MLQDEQPDYHGRTCRSATSHGGNSISGPSNQDRIYLSKVNSKDPEVLMVLKNEAPTIYRRLILFSSLIRFLADVFPTIGPLSGGDRKPGPSNGFRLATERPMKDK